MKPPLCSFVKSMTTKEGLKSPDKLHTALPLQLRHMSAMASGSTNHTVIFRGISWQTTHKIPCHYRDTILVPWYSKSMVNLTAGSTAWQDNNKWNLKDPHYSDILVRIFRLTLLVSNNCSMSFQNIMVQYIHSMGLYPSFSIKHNLDIMHKHYIFLFQTFCFQHCSWIYQWNDV